MPYLAILIQTSASRTKKLFGLLRKSQLTLMTTLFVLSACSSSQPKVAPLTHYPDQAKIDRIWRTSAGLGNSDSYLKLQPSLNTQHQLFAADVNGNVTAFNAQTGERLWRVHFQHLVANSNLTSTSDAVYFVSKKGKLLKLDAQSGQLIWEKTLPSTAIAAPLVLNGMIYTKTLNGEITAWKDTSKDGNNKTAATWSYQQTNPSLILRASSHPIMHQNHIIAGFANGTLASLDKKNGDVTWSKQITEPKGKTDVERMVDIDATPVAESNRLYTATYQGSLVAVNSNYGDILWHRSSSIFNNIALDGQVLYATDADSHVHAFDKNTGESLWHQDALENRHVTAPAIMDNYVVVGDQEGYLHVMDIESGELVARTKVNGTGISATPIPLDHTLLVLSNGGVLYAYTISNLS